MFGAELGLQLLPDRFKDQVCVLDFEIAQIFRARLRGCVRYFHAAPRLTSMKSVRNAVGLSLSPGTLSAKIAALSMALSLGRAGAKRGAGRKGLRLRPGAGGSVSRRGDQPDPIHLN